MDRLTHQARALPVLARIGEFTNAVRHGTHTGFTGRRITDVVSIGTKATVHDLKNEKRVIFEIRGAWDSDPDNGVIVAAYLGSWLMAGGFLAIGSCMSAMTRNSVIAFILTVAICFVFVASGSEIILNALRWAPQILVDASLPGVSVPQEHVKAGKIIPLGVAVPTRMRGLPDVPTFQELGISNFEVPGWVAIGAVLAWIPYATRPVPVVAPAGCGGRQLPLLLAQAPPLAPLLRGARRGRSSP